MQKFIKKLIERLKERSEKWFHIWDESINNGDYDDYADGMNDAFNEAIEIVNELAEEYKGGWIPCSEKQPPKPRFKEDTYLIQQIDVVAPFSAYWNGECWSDVLDDKLDNVIAWMPLPAPYKERE